MNYRNITRPLVLAVVALMALASSASASKITGPGGNQTPVIHAVAEGHVTLHNSIADISCPSTFSGKVESHGTPNTPKGGIAISFPNCTNSWVVHVQAGGSLETHITAANTGTLTSSGLTIIATRFGVECRYKTENTTIGHVTGEKGTNGEATLHINNAILWHGGSALCGFPGPALWTGSYITTETLALDQ